MDDALRFACWSLTPALAVVGVLFRKNLSVPQALSTYAIGPVVGLTSAGLLFLTWKAAFNGRALLGSSAMDPTLPLAAGALVGYFAPFIGVAFRRGRALPMGVVAVLAPVTVLLTVNTVLREGLATGSAVEPLWLCLLVVVPTAFCLTPGEPMTSRG